VFSIGFCKKSIYYMLYLFKQEQPPPDKQDQPPPDTVDRILATIYGQCIGDAIGLLTEFLTKREAELVRHIYITRLIVF